MQLSMSWKVMCCVCKCCAGSYSLTGLLHISEVSWDLVQDIGDILNVDDEVRVKVISIDRWFTMLWLCRIVAWFNMLLIFWGAHVVLWYPLLNYIVTSPRLLYNWCIMHVHPPNVPNVTSYALNMNVMKTIGQILAHVQYICGTCLWQTLRQG